MSGKSEKERIDEIVDRLTESSPRTVPEKPDLSVVPAAKRQNATYQLRVDTVEQIKAITQQERFSGKQYSRIAQALLDFAIAEYWAGEAVVEMVTESDNLRRPTMRRKSDDSPVKPGLNQDSPG